MCVHVNAFLFKVKAANKILESFMMTVKSLVSQIITGCSLGQAYCSFVCHLYMLDLKRLEETITGAMKETVSMIWLAEVSVAVAGKTEICSKTWRKHCPIWLCTLFSRAKGFYTPYFFSYSGAILIILFCISLLWDMPGWSWPQQL